MIDRLDMGNGVTLYQTTLTERPPHAQPKSYEQSREFFKPEHGDLAKMHWILLEYPVGLQDIVCEHFRHKIPKVLFDVTEERLCTSVFVHKEDFAKLLAKLQVGAVKPVAVLRANLPPRAGKAVVKGTLLRLCVTRECSAVPRRTIMKLLKEEEKEAFTAEILYTRVKDMSDEAFAACCLNARLKPAKARDDTENLLADGAVESRLINLRKLKGIKVYNVVLATKPRPMVQSPSAFKDSWKLLEVTVHDASLLPESVPRIDARPNVVTLESFIQCKELHHNVTLLVLGQTRLGKSELAKMMCLHLAVMYHPVDKACFVFALTIDALRHNQAHMLPGVPVLLDDMKVTANGQDQIIYSDASIWKSVLQCKDASATRARSNEWQWAYRQPKMITTNTATLDKWVSELDPRAEQEHIDALKARLAEVTVTERLYVNATAPEDWVSYLPAVASYQEAAATLSSLFD